jgi:hypothetical protein
MPFSLCKKYFIPIGVLAIFEKTQKRPNRNEVRLSLYIVYYRAFIGSGPVRAVVHELLLKIASWHNVLNIISLLN